MVESEDHAAMSARHLAEAAARIEQQRELMDRLHRFGLDTAIAEAVLKNFEAIIDTMLVHDAIIRRGARGF
jgi:hypothetical protein